MRFGQEVPKITAQLLQSFLLGSQAGRGLAPTPPLPSAQQDGGSRAARRSPRPQKQGEGRGSPCSLVPRGPHAVPAPSLPRTGPGVGRAAQSSTHTALCARRIYEPGQEPPRGWEGARAAAAPQLCPERCQPHSWGRETSASVCGRRASAWPPPILAALGVLKPPQRLGHTVPPLPSPPSGTPLRGKLSRAPCWVQPGTAAFMGEQGRAGGSPPAGHVPLPCPRGQPSLGSPPQRGQPP